MLGLAGLVIAEVALLESFLPHEWRHAIHLKTERVFPSARYDPHPDMDWEFELDYRQHPAHRVVLYGAVGSFDSWGWVSHAENLGKSLDK